MRVRTARRYILRVCPDGTLRVTIPRGGSRAEAANFMQRHLAWVARERARVRQVQAPVRWTAGSTILLDGEPATIVIEEIVPLADVEFMMVERALRVAHGNQSQAARLLQVSRDQLRYRVKRYREEGRLVATAD